MHVQLELLAPARNAEIGIAAIDCGADAVYIAGPAFGARQAAGNSIEDLQKLCTYAHQYGSRIFVTLNTILYDEELEEAGQLLQEVAAAGADAVIIQDTALLALAEKNDIPSHLELHASTQCAIRTPEQARFLESLGFSRIVLERELSLQQIQAIREAVQCELEFFVHGALCVCYSGQCYISEYISGRSANRGACMQACRSRYNLVDNSGKTLVRNKALLSLKDYKLIGNIQDLADSGICSFKIEGRLKNISYVKNVVRAYSMAIDTLVDQYPGRYVRASFGKVKKGFQPDLDKTFNRSYTSLFIDGQRGKWASMDAPKGMGEEIGKVSFIRYLGKEEMEIIIRNKQDSLKLSNGDGFSFYTDKEIIGFRGDICHGNQIRCKRISELKTGIRLFRNFSTDFEKSLVSQPCQREMDVELQVSISAPSTHTNDYILTAQARTEDGRTASFSISSAEAAKDTERMSQLIQTQLSKKSGIYSFHASLPTGSRTFPFLSSSALNSVRRELANLLDKKDCLKRPATVLTGKKEQIALPDKVITYKQNISNHLASALMTKLGATEIEPAFEIAHQAKAELMRTKYCIRYELGICPHHQGAKESGPLFLINNGQRFPLLFDCKNCEMVIKTPEK